MAHQQTMSKGEFGKTMKSGMALGKKKPAEEEDKDEEELEVEKRLKRQ